jgi:RNA polymerase sigma-70 factor (ECF subfamily)
MDLLRRAQRGDHAAFAQLVEHNRPSLIRFCQGYLRDYHRAEDAAQVAFTRAWAHIGDCQGEFRPWLLKIAKNHGLDELKKAEHRRIVRFPEEIDLAEIASKHEPLDELVARRLDLIAAIQCLPLPYRAVVDLRTDGETYASIAQRLGIRPAAARQRFARAVKVLRIVLAQGARDDEVEAAQTA